MNLVKTAIANACCKSVLCIKMHMVTICMMDYIMINSHYSIQLCAWRVTFVSVRISYVFGFSTLISYAPVYFLVKLQISCNPGAKLAL